MRSDRNYPDVYFGRPGSLVKMPYPRDGVNRPLAKPVYVFDTSYGQSIVSSIAGGGSRTYSLGWRSMHMDTFAKIEPYWHGQYGPGPWVYIDPSMPNMLLPNQSSCTALFADPRHLSVVTGQLQSNNLPALIHNPRFARNLGWYWQPSPGAVTCILSFMSPYRSWYGFPVVPGLPYYMAGWFNFTANDPTANLKIELQWLSATGSVISTTSPSYTTISAWTRLSTQGTAPSTAAYVAPRILVDGSTLTAGLVTGLGIEELILEQDSVVNDWAPGTGLRPVEILELPETAPFNGRWRTGTTMTLRELAP